jgi:hypothetical protein
MLEDFDNVKFSHHIKLKKTWRQKYGFVMWGLVGILIIVVSQQ